MKHIRKILAVLLIAILFVSCNADMTGMGILNTIKHSKPDTSFKIKEVSGILSGERFLIETEDGIDVYNVSNRERTNLVRGLNATLRFVINEPDKNTVFYTTNESGSKTYYATVIGDFTSTSDSKEVSFKAGDDVTLKNIEASFYEDGDYIILAKDSNNNYYFIKNPSNGSMNADGTCYKFNEFVAVTDKGEAPDYLGFGYYYVEHGNDNKSITYKIHDLEGSTEITLEDKSSLTALPFAVSGDYLFADGGVIYKISKDTRTMSQVSNTENKHSIVYHSRNHLAPMVNVGGTVYGIANAKPFKWDGTTFTNYAYMADIHIIALYYLDNTFYAFSDSNGVYASTDGETYIYK